MNTTHHRRDRRTRGTDRSAAGPQRLARDHPGPGQPVRGRDARPPVDPRRCRQGEGRVALRRAHRPRIPNPVPAAPLPGSDRRGHRGGDGHQLRPQSTPFPGAGSRRRPGSGSVLSWPRASPSPVGRKCNSTAASRSRAPKNPPSPPRWCSATTPDRGVSVFPVATEP